MSARAKSARFARAAAFGLLLTAGTAGAATPDGSVEFAVKAAYLYKFGEFVEWPAAAFESNSSPVVLCIVGNDPFGATLDKAVAGQKIASRTISVKRLKAAEPHSGCQVMYVSGQDASVLGKALETVRGEGVLTITDGVAGTAPAGIINFVINNNRVRFEIDDGAAVTNGLVISSKLLALASSVKPKG